MNINDAKIKNIYEIVNINSENSIKEFLFSLGCFEGQKISVVKKTKSNLIINIKGIRYAIDCNLANLIEVA